MHSSHEKDEIPDFGKIVTRSVLMSQVFTSLFFLLYPSWGILFSMLLKRPIGFLNNAVETVFT